MTRTGAAESRCSHTTATDTGCERGALRDSGTVDTLPEQGTVCSAAAHVLLSSRRARALTRKGTPSPPPSSFGGNSEQRSVVTRPCGLRVAEAADERMVGGAAG